MYSPWKLLRGTEDWEHYQTHLVVTKSRGECHNIVGNTPVSYPCLVQSIQRTSNNGGVDLVNHQQFFVYALEAEFLVNFHNGKIR